MRKLIVGLMLAAGSVCVTAQPSSIDGSEGHSSYPDKDGNPSGLAYGSRSGEAYKDEPDLSGRTSIARAEDNVISVTYSVGTHGTVQCFSCN